MRLLLLLTLACIACSSDGSAPGPSPEVLVGTPTGDDKLEFSRLEPDSELMLETFFQGGTHVTLAIRCIGLGRSAFVEASIKNLTSGATVSANTPSSSPRPLICRDEHACDLLPFMVMMSGITTPEEQLDGLEVLVSARAENRAGDVATGSQRARLSTDLLP